MVELYRRRVWTDARTVNVIASACLSKVRSHSGALAGCRLLVWVGVCV